MPSSQNSIRPFFLRTLYLVLTVFFIWFWTGNEVLRNYNLQLTAFIVVFYFVSRFFLAPKNKEIILETIVLTSSLLLILTSTGGLGSPLFFLVYFLLFAVSLLFDPPTTLVLTLILVLFFANSLTSLNAALQLLSLLFITPLAIFFGKQYLRLLETQQKIKILVQKNKEEEAVGRKISADITEEETNTLLWLSLNLKNGLLQIIHQTTELLSDLSHLTFTQKERLQKIHEAAKELLKSGERLKERIDRETD